MIDDIILPKFSFFLQGSDYRAEDKCREENNSLKKCMVERYRGWAGICNNERKRAKKCVNEVQVELLQI